MIHTKIWSLYTYKRFAKLVATGYRLILDDINTLLYNISLGGEYCPQLTNDRIVNECLNFIMDRLELDVGEMVPKRKQKLGTSS